MDRAATIKGQLWRWHLSGPPSAAAVVFLHGIGADSCVWHPVVEQMREYRAVVVDIPGVALACTPDEAYGVGRVLDFDGIVQGLLAVLAMEKIERFHVVGHSFGAALALEIASRAPRRCLSVSLVAPGGFGPELAWSVRALGSRAGSHILGVTYQLLGPHRLAHLTFLAKPSVRRFIDVDEMVDSYRRLATRTQRSSFRRTVRLAIDSNTPERRSRVHAFPPGVAVLVLWGTHDPILPAAHLAKIKSTLPQARIVEVVDAGHAIHRSHSALVAFEVCDLIKGRV